MLYSTIKNLLTNNLYNILPTSLGINFSQRHGFHLVDPSACPLITSLCAFVTTTGAVSYFHGYNYGGLITFIGLVCLTISMFVWFRDIVRESTFEGHHTNCVQLGLRYGMLLFIASEVMFFFAFFWAFFTASLSPTVDIGAIFPPKGIDVFDPFQVPLLNTVILLLSGVTATWCHHAVLAGNRTQAIAGLLLTIGLAIIFTSLQGFEYTTANFRISDGVYGSCFYMATGFHGTHVVIGSIFLCVCLVRLIKFHYTQEHHAGLEFGLWYWHFVDVVWIFLYFVVYIWGGM